MTGRFDTIVVVDWSGGADTGSRPRGDAIWAAVLRDGRSEEPVYLRSREVAGSWLADLAAAELDRGRRVFAGFDFPFGYPDGFARQVVGAVDPLALWDRLAELLEAHGGDRFSVAAELNGLFPETGPFWFNGGARDFAALPRKGGERTPAGLAERRRVELQAKGAFPCWQMGGKGSAGSQAMTGQAALSRLRARFAGQVAVWPFETHAAPLTLAEVWPSLIADAIAAQAAPDEIRDRAQVRVLAGALDRMQAAGTLAQALAAVPDDARREEGWILGVGAEAELRAAATPSPPVLRNDCFALPAGVAWTPVDEALERLRTALSCVTGTETVATGSAGGRVLAEDVPARRANPPAANAAVDGYGFARASVGEGVQTLPLVPGRAAAGEPYRDAVPAGSALRILTGAVLPAGVDTVVLEEDVQAQPEAIGFHADMRAGANTRKKGEDVAAGEVALERGRVLGPPDLALLTALGVAEVTVRRPLRVGVLSTGDELASPDPEADPSRTFDANRPMLLDLVRRWGHAPVDLGRVDDDREALRARLDTASVEADAVLTSGGASAGDEDHVSALLREAGAMETWRIAMKPGRPLALGLWRGVPVFGLPGNPVAAFVCALVFARPALSLMAGAGWRVPRALTVEAAFEKRKKPGRREYLRARLDEAGRAEVFASEGSGRISGLSWASGLVELEDGGRHVRPGDPVRFLPYSAFGL